RLPVRTPPPVLARGEGDTGPVAQGSTLPPVPTIEEAVLADGQPSAVLGDTIVLTGHNLDGIRRIEIAHPRLPEPRTIAVPPAGVTSESIELSLPDDRHALA